MKMYDFVMCIPPISQVNYPYIAVPLLKSVAALNGYSVVVKDLNIDFLNYLIEKNPKFSGMINANQLNDYFLNFRYSNIIQEFTREWIERHFNGARILGFSITSRASYDSAIQAAEKIKSFQKDILIIFGGAFCDKATAKYILSQHNVVDVVCIGESENTLLEILQKFDESGINSLKDVRGTAIKLNNNKIILNEPRSPTMDLDSFPFPDYSCIPIEDYLNFRIGTRVLPILGSRGCIGNCSFCSETSIWGCYRARSPENITEEIKYQHEKYGIKIFRFNDSLLNAKISRLEKICDLLIEESIDIAWVGNVRIHPGMSYGLLKKMHRAGCRILWYGIESASPRILRIMGKGVNIEYAPRILRETKEVGIAVLTFWITDFPGEKIVDVKKTIDFLREYGKYIDFTHFTEYHLHKNSEMFNNPSKYGIIIKDTDRFGNPIWACTNNIIRSNEILENAGRQHVKRPRLPWDFIGSV